MIYEYDAFIEVPEKLGEDKMAELDCAIAYFVEDRFGFPVEFSIVGQVDEEKGDCEIEKIVRCKDCKYNGIWCDIQDIEWTEKGKPIEFCSYGDRKEQKGTQG